MQRAAGGGCPALLLAPMENLMDRRTRVALHSTLAQHHLGAFDEACTGQWLRPGTGGSCHGDGLGAGNLTFG
jgi:hypothetical protein